MKKLAIIFSLIIICKQSFSQWEKSNVIGQSVGSTGLLDFSQPKVSFLMETSEGDPKLFYSLDTGKTWMVKRLFFNISFSNRYVFIRMLKDGNLMLASTGHIEVMDTTFLVTDTVYKFDTARTGFVQSPYRHPQFHYFTPDTAYMLSNNLFRTVDGGINWQRVNDFFVGAHFNFHFVDRQNGYFLGWETIYNTLKLFTTKDGGKTWDSTGPPLDGKTGTSLQFISPDTGFLAGNDNCLYKTTDRGKTWNKHYCLNDGQPASYIKSIAFTDKNIGWITIDQRNQPFKTVDGGNTFFSQPLPQTASLINDVKIVTPNLVFLTGVGLYRTTNQGGSPLLSVKDIDESPLQHGGITIYPNPTNSRFAIDTKREGEVFTAEIYDITGRLVLAVDNVQNNQQLEVSSLIAGTYIVRVLSRDKTSNFILIKE